MRHISDTIFRNSIKLYRKKVYSVKLCNVKYLSIYQKKNYVSFCAISSTLLIGIHWNHTGRKLLLLRYTTWSYVLICQKCQSMSIFDLHFLYAWYLRHYPTMIIHKKKVYISKFVHCQIIIWFVRKFQNYFNVYILT